MSAAKSVPRGNASAINRDCTHDTFHSTRVPAEKLQTSDTNKSPSKRAMFLMNFAKMTSQLRWDFTEVAFENAVLAFTVAMKAKMRPLVVENLENNEGGFIDFTSEARY